MRFSPSGVPLFSIDDGPFKGMEFWPWEWRKYLDYRKAEKRAVPRLEWLSHQPVAFSEGRRMMIGYEWDGAWQYYLPEKPIPKDALILDGGAGEGETGFFFMEHGYTNLRLIEPLRVLVERAKANLPGVEIREKMFTLDDLEGVAYAKLDVEGGEALLATLDRLPCEMVVAIHKKVWRHENYFVKGLKDVLVSKFHGKYLGEDAFETHWRLYP